MNRTAVKYKTNAGIKNKARVARVDDDLDGLRGIETLAPQRVE